MKRLHSRRVCNLKLVYVLNWYFEHCDSVNLSVSAVLSQFLYSLVINKSASVDSQMRLVLYALTLLLIVIHNKGISQFYVQEIDPRYKSLSAKTVTKVIS